MTQILLEKTQTVGRECKFYETRHILSVVQSYANKNLINMCRKVISY